MYPILQDLLNSSKLRTYSFRSLVIQYVQYITTTRILAVVGFTVADTFLVNVE